MPTPSVGEQHAHTPLSLAAPGPSLCHPPHSVAGRESLRDHACAQAWLPQVVCEGVRAKLALMFDDAMSDLMEQLWAALQHAGGAHAKAARLHNAMVKRDAEVRAPCRSGVHLGRPGAHCCRPRPDLCAWTLRVWRAGGVSGHGEGQGPGGRAAGSAGQEAAACFPGCQRSRQGNAAAALAHPAPRAPRLPLQAKLRQAADQAVADATRMHSVALAHNAQVRRAALPPAPFRPHQQRRRLHTCCGAGVRATDARTRRRCVAWAR